MAEHKQAILKLTFYNTDNFLYFLFRMYIFIFFFAVISYTIRLTFCDSGGSTEQKNNRLSKHTNLCHIQFYDTSIISLEAQVKAIALFCFMRETIEFD